MDMDEVQHMLLPCRELVAQMLTYNADAHALGFCSALFTWTEAGAISASFSVLVSQGQCGVMQPRCNKQ